MENTWKMSIFFSYAEQGEDVRYSGGVLSHPPPPVLRIQYTTFSPQHIS